MNRLGCIRADNLAGGSRLKAAATVVAVNLATRKYKTKAKPKACTAQHTSSVGQLQTFVNIYFS
jgi:hypothetical protein